MSPRKPLRTKRSNNSPIGMSTLLGPHVVLVGGNRVATQIQRALQKEYIAVVAHDSVSAAELAITELTRAVLVVPPVSGTALARACVKFVKRKSQIPVFVACGPTAQKTVADLYKSGVKAVFYWSADREPLLRTLLRLCRPTAGKPPKRGPQDVALEELVSSHLKTDTSFGAKLSVRVRNRIAMLFGHVDALWKVATAKDIAGSVQGVQEVYPDGIIVSGPTDLTDRSIANAARQVLKHTSDVNASTLAIAVKAGTATISGSVASHHELSRVVDLLSHVRGVRKIENWAVVSAVAKRKDNQVAKEIRKAVAVRYPRVKLDVSVFGGVAILSGKVDSFAERQALESLTNRQAGVRRVVDKLLVRKPRV